VRPEAALIHSELHTVQNCTLKSKAGLDNAIIACVVQEESD